MGLEQSLRFRREAKAVTRGIQCNERSDESRVPCYKDPHALSNPTRLVIWERNFVPRNAGAARKSQAFPLERELPTPSSPLERTCTSRNWIPNDRKRIRNGRIAAAVTRTRDILLNNLTTIVRGTCECVTWIFCDFTPLIVTNKRKIVEKNEYRRNQLREENYRTIMSLK